MIRNTFPRSFENKKYISYLIPEKTVDTQNMAHAEGRPSIILGWLLLQPTRHPVL